VFKRRTVFIVGAGASAEFGLPVGGGLAQKIARMMDIRFEYGTKPIGEGDMQLYTQLTNGMRDHVREFQQAALLIRDGIQLARSIDDFLDMHRSSQFVVTYGKVAIVKAILEAENSSTLHFDRFKNETFDTSKVADTWLVKFMQMLGPGIPFENIQSIFSNVSFVVFNYDRCIEFFLLHALQRLYGISEEDAKKTIATLTIIHPYGVIAPSVEFGTAGRNYIELANGIKTYTEQVRDKSILTVIAEQVKAAQIPKSRPPAGPHYCAEQPTAHLYSLRRRSYHRLTCVRTFWYSSATKANRSVDPPKNPTFSNSQLFPRDFARLTKFVKTGSDEMRPRSFQTKRPGGPQMCCVGSL
jgi:hypothetical protein